jgi:hypothetical protein
MRGREFWRRPFSREERSFRVTFGWWEIASGISVPLLRNYQYPVSF